jgi:hypothetical protein
MHAAELVTGTTIVSTRFNAPVHTILVLIDDQLSSNAERGLSLTLDGADRLVDQQGQAVPPIAVIVANRSALIYSVVPTKADAGPVTVSVGSQAGWHLSGVMAGDDAPETLANRIAASGLDSLVGPVVPGNHGTVKLSWVEGQSPAPAPTPPSPTNPTTVGTPTAPAPAPSPTLPPSKPPTKVPTTPPVGPKAAKSVGMKSVAKKNRASKFSAKKAGAKKAGAKKAQSKKGKP